MAYLPRVAFAAACAHCGVDFAAQHLGHKYCPTPRNALATQTHKKGRLATVETILINATAELARVRAELAALRPAQSPVSIPAPSPAPRQRACPPGPSKRPSRPRVLLKRTERLAGRKLVPGSPARLLGGTYLPGNDPATVLQPYISPVGMWWRLGRVGVWDAMMCTKRFWISTDERVWVERSSTDPSLVRVTDVSASKY